jgi:hypothetical protein
MKPMISGILSQLQRLPGKQPQRMPGGPMKPPRIMPSGPMKPPRIMPSGPIKPGALTRTPPAIADYYSYGAPPMGVAPPQMGIPMVAPRMGIPTVPRPVMAARRGGALSEVSSQFVRGPGTGRSDAIPARLSNGEYILDAETVALLGDGSSDAGARRLDEMRRLIRQHKGKTLAKGKFSPDAKRPMSYLRK